MERRFFSKKKKTLSNNPIKKLLPFCLLFAFITLLRLTLKSTIAIVDRRLNSQFIFDKMLTFCSFIHVRFRSLSLQHQFASMS